MPIMIYHNQNGLLKPIKRRPFVVQLNRPHRSTPGPCLTKKRDSGYRACNKNKKCPFFACVRALFFGEARALAGPCVHFERAMRPFLVFRARDFLFPVRALLLGHARDFFRPMRTFFFSVRAIYFPNCGWVHRAVRAIWLFSGAEAYKSVETDTKTKAGARSDTPPHASDIYVLRVVHFRFLVAE